MSAAALNTLHNLHFYLDTMRAIRKSIESGTFESFRARFLQTYDSGAVRAKMDKATAMAKAFKLDGVPALAVNGKWFTAPHMTGTRENALRVVEYLLARERRGG